MSPRNRAHGPECRCGDCWPFAAGSEAEKLWVKGIRWPDLVGDPEHCSSAEVPPAPVVRVGGVLPGDLEVYAARADVARSLAAEFPSLLGCTQSEEGNRDDDHSEAPPGVD